MSTATLEANPAKPRSLFQMLAAHPLGFWFIFWGELAERCSYYGMMAILGRFISEFLTLGDGAATTWVSTFKAACYFLPLLGGFLADQYLGKYRLIVIFSIPYILGHVILAGETVTYTLIALALLAMGSGVIKPNISTLMGLTYDQKRPGDDQLRTMAFGMFYMAINIGATISYGVLPVIRDSYGYAIAFMCPAVLMGISFVFFAAGKPFYAVEHVQRRVSTPAEWEEKKITLRRIAGLFLIVIFFWVDFDQTHTTWVFFARDFTDLSILGWRLSPEQVGLINPLLIVLFVPLLTVVWAQLAARGIKARPTDKIMVGFFLTAATMGVMTFAGYESGNFEKRPALKNPAESAPFIITTPNVDIKAVKAYQQSEKKETAPPIDDATKLQLVWIIQENKPEVKREGKSTVISWGLDPADRVVLTSTDDNQPKVEIDVDNSITVTSQTPFKVAYSGNVTATEKRVVAGRNKVSLWWVTFAFILLTLAEVLISVTGLELAFVVSPLSMKSFVTALWLLTVGIANLFINAPVGQLYDPLTPAQYFGLLTGMTVVVIVALYFVAKRFNVLGEEQAKLARQDAMAAKDSAE